MPSATSPVFQPPLVSLTPLDSPKALRSLPDLIQFHVDNNPSHLFCVQAESSLLSTSDDRQPSTSLIKITYSTLKQAILRCQVWLEKEISSLQIPVHSDGREQNESYGLLHKPNPVALLVDSDFALVIYLLTLMGLGRPVVLLSTRLSVPSIRHLIQQTNASDLIVSKRLYSLAEEAISEGSEATNSTIHVAEHFQSFLQGPHLIGSIAYPEHFIAEDDRNSLILHSSGTSGLPKPIYCSHRHFLGKSVCQDVGSLRENVGLTISTSPFFHGFGMVPICLSLGIGQPFCIPASAQIPSGSLIVDLIEASDAKSLLTVPHLLEEIAALPLDRGIKALARLNFVAFGGGLPKATVGKRLDAAGVKLINHYGATETGPLTPFFAPPPGHDWHFVRLRTDSKAALEVRLEEVAQVNLTGPAYRLSMRPFGWKERFELQDLLVPRPGGSSLEEFAVVGRTDDLICLATGEKVRPAVLESCVVQYPGVKAATAFGDGQFELGILVESEEKLNEAQQELLKASLWPIIETAGQEMDAHARITTPAMVLIVSPASLPRSDKGTILRREVNAKFASEIANAYENLETDTDGQVFDPTAPSSSIRNMVSKTIAWRHAPDEWSNDDDFFQLGMDSLQATKLRRALMASLRAARHKSEAIQDPAIVYRYPSVNELVRVLTQGTLPLGAAISEDDALKTFVDEFSVIAPAPVSGAVIVMTGSTGSLGSFLLADLLRSEAVARVVCLIRPSQQDEILRQKSVLESRNILLTPDQQSKLSVYATQTDRPYLGLTESSYQALTATVTHVFHIAWPMDFLQMLPSFTSAFRTLRELIQLTVHAQSLHLKRRPRLLFASSISVVGSHPNIKINGQARVVEAPLKNNAWTLDLGYAKAKLVCEKMIERAAMRYPDIEMGYVRIGQIAGSAEGFWNANEHLVSLISSAQKIGMLPDLSGTFSWIPVDTAASVLSEIMFAPRALNIVYHLENPHRQPWGPLIKLLAAHLQLATSKIVPFAEWIDTVNASALEGNPAQKIVTFLRNDFVKMSCGSLALDMYNSLDVAPSLRDLGPVKDETIIRYLQYWKSIGSLK